METGKRLCLIEEQIKRIAVLLEKQITSKTEKISNSPLNLVNNHKYQKTNKACVGYGKSKF